MTWWRQLWLHDIGYAPELAGTGCHPLDGARYLRRIGVDEQVVSLVAYHSCARIEAEVRGLRPATAHRVHRTARTAFGEAVKRGYIARNPSPWPSRRELMNWKSTPSRPRRSNAF
jgi:hypothetical protein